MADNLTNEQRQEIIDAIYKYQKIEAIRLYRKASGCDLKASKDFVEALESALRVENPEAFGPRPSGCGAGAALLLISPLGLYWWMTQC